MKTVEFAGYTCNVDIGSYTNKRPLIGLIDNGCPVAIATINLPSIETEPDEVIIKNYSENTGIDDVLIEAGVISKEPLYYVDSGFVENMPVHKLLFKG